MAEFLGADPAQLRTLAKEMSHFAESLDHTVQTLASAINQSNGWHGPDALSFRQQWHNSMVPTVGKAVSYIKDTATSLLKNADEQEKASAAEGGSAVADPDRRGAEREARDSRRGRGGGSPDGPQGEGTDGDPAYKPDGLGEPVPGEHVGKPSAPPWKPADADSQVHGSEGAGITDHGKKFAVETAANAAAVVIPHASRNLLHYLGNDGKPLSQDVDSMLKDCPQLRAQTEHDVDNLAQAAVAQAKASGATGPVTFPVNTPWTGYYIGEDESKDWFFATGGMQYSHQGQVTVYPPSTPDGVWRYETDTSVSYRDRYNWDNGKGTQVGPIHVSDKTLGDLNKVGLANNFNMEGESSEQHRTGEAK